MLKHFFLAVLFIISIDSYSQDRNFNIANYNTARYAFGESTVWAIAQDKRGLLYAGTANGILEYDGHDWRFIKVKEGLWVRSLAVDSTNKILVGSYNEFGFLEPDKKGYLIYHSLSDSLKEKSKNFGTIWKIHPAKQGNIFQSESKIFISNNLSIKEINPETSFHLSFYLNDTLYVRERNIGFLKYFNGKFLPVNGGEQFFDIGIFAMLPYKKNETLIVTQQNGIWKYTNSDITLLPSNINSIFNKNVTYGGIKLSDGNFAFNTLNVGVSVHDFTKFKYSLINKEDGLNTNRVNQIIQDKQGNICLATNKGISIIEYTSPFTYYKEESGLLGNIIALNRYNGILYIGTTEGLFVQNRNKKSVEEKQFVKVNGFETEVRSIIHAADNLLLLTVNGIYELSYGHFNKISELSGNCMYYSSKNKYLVLGNDNLITVFKKTKYWERILSVSNFNINPQAIAENHSYTQGNEFWFGSNNQGALRLILTNDLKYSIENFTEKEGLSKDWILPFEYHDSIVFGTQHGLLSFTEENVSVSDDSTQTDSIISLKYFNVTNLLGFSTNLPVNMLFDTKDRIWLSIDNNLMYIDENQKNNLVSKPFLEFDMGKINIVYQDNDNGLLWIGSDNGLIRYDSGIKKDFFIKYKCIIRKILCGKDSILFAGSSDSIFQEHPVLNYRLNNLTFEFSAPYFPKENTIQYAYNLEGLNDYWSEWSAITTKEFSNLQEGRYVFHIKAKNVYGVESEISSYGFTILPPWYRTMWAYFVYFIFLIITIVLAVYLGRLRLKAKNKELEQKVRDRTAEIMHQKEEIEKQSIQIEKQNLQITESIKYAQHIQEAVQPMQIFINEVLPEHFILLKPKDIVSGDFFWIGRKYNKTIIAAVDGTGHGVPGAFINMLGVALLNEIVNNIEICDIKADQILNILRSKVIKTLHQRGKAGEIQDGMDLAICIVDFDKLNLEFSGAYNPLYLIRNNILTEVKADPMPIGIYTKDNEPFTNHSVELKKNDNLYIFSDGYYSQFGGTNGDEKLKRKPFKDLLLEINNMSMTDQKQFLEDYFDNWKGKQEQTDDILVIGIRISE
jgi:serine phosphatase RsbU (regulator of sigma subunit)/ligand-binding sensor domain-containing protein